jgi:hypothetical protein
VGRTGRIHSKGGWRSADVSEHRALNKLNIKTKCIYIADRRNIRPTSRCTVFHIVGAPQWLLPYSDEKHRCSKDLHSNEIWIVRVSGNAVYTFKRPHYLPGADELFFQGMSGCLCHGLYSRYPHIQSNRRRPLEARGLDSRTIPTTSFV